MLWSNTVVFLNLWALTNSSVLELVLKKKKTQNPSVVTTERWLMRDAESRESHQPTLARFGDAVKLDRDACHHKSTKWVGVRTSDQRTNSLSCWWYKQTLAGSCLSGSKVELCKGTVESLLGMMEVFSTFSFSMTQILLWPGTFHLWDPSWMFVIFRSSGGSQVWCG